MPFRFLLTVPVYLIGVFLLTTASSFGAEAPWAVPEASLRFLVHLDDAPSHPKCGYLIQLPDGGILPKSFLTTSVVDKNGKIYPSYDLWRNEHSGLTQIFPDPGTLEDVWLYLSPAGKPRKWTPRTELKPSAILCTDPTGGSPAQARALASFGPVGPTVHQLIKAGIPRAPFSIGGDESGRPLPASFYLLSHVITTDPGKTWIAPFAINGEHTVLVNGELLTPTKRIDKWGGTGQYFDLPAGFNRIEVFASAPRDPLYTPGKMAGGIMYLTWKPPNASIEELGGVRGEDVPMAGTSNQESRVLHPKEIARSGRATVTSVQTREGLPVARVTGKAVGTYWVADEKPQILFRFTADTKGHPENTRYLWTFSDGGRVEGTECTWLVPGFIEGKVTLTLQSGSHQSQTQFPYYGYTTLRTSLDKPADRREYRKALLEMLLAQPSGTNPTKNWSPSQWAYLYRTLEYGKGYNLLYHLFANCWKTETPNIPADKLRLLEDAFIDVAPRKDPEQAIAIARTFHNRAKDPIRQLELKLREVEISMFYLGKTNEVESALENLVRMGGETGEKARIRLGDLAFMDHDLNLATSYYAGVQNRARLQRNQPGTPDAPQTQSKNAGNWKVSTLLNTASAEQAKTQIAQGYLLEANRTLEEWERTFPLSKITGDFILQEARFHIATGNYLRARPMLKAYCQNMDASSYLPDAAVLLLDCLQETKAPQEEIRVFAADMHERLKFHPSAWMFEEQEQW